LETRLLGVLGNADIEETDALIETANRFVETGIRAKDALHVVAAIAGKADAFITTIQRQEGDSEIWLDAGMATDTEITLSNRAACAWNSGSWP